MSSVESVSKTSSGIARAKGRNFKKQVYSTTGQGQKKLFTNAMKNPEMANIMKPS